MLKHVLLLSAALFFIGCQTMPYQPYARDVKRKPSEGGVIALKTEHNEQDRAKAESMMKSNCGTTPVKVLEEGEVTVGETTSGSATEKHQAGASGSKVGSLFGMPITSGGVDPSKNTHTTTTTTALKEWQISYACGNPTPAAKSTKK